MATTKAQQRAVHKYVRENYDRLNITIPKGQKQALQAAADKRGESINQFTNRAILARMGLTEWAESAEE